MYIKCIYTYNGDVLLEYRSPSFAILPVSPARSLVLRPCCKLNATIRRYPGA